VSNCAAHQFAMIPTETPLQTEATNNLEFPISSANSSDQNLC